ncbi:hypothetical protein JW756_01095 [Candidatus Woesearchaeota archaeon]|nr:hypothetical protein [Candidatus Woesearchaeota archaeon]
MKVNDYLGSYLKESLEEKTCTGWQKFKKGVTTGITLLMLSTASAGILNQPAYAHHKEKKKQEQTVKKEEKEPGFFGIAINYWRDVIFGKKEKKTQPQKKPSKSKTYNSQTSKTIPKKTASTTQKQEAPQPVPPEPQIIINVYQLPRPANQGAQSTVRTNPQTTPKIVKKERKLPGMVVDFKLGYIMEGRTIVREEQDPQESNQGVFAQAEIMNPGFRLAGNIFWTRNPKTERWYGGNILNNRILQTNIAADYILANFLNAKLMLEHASSNFISQDDVSFRAGLPSTSYTLIRAGGGVNIPLKKDSPDWYAQAIYFFGRGNEKFNVESSYGKVTREAVPFNTSGFLIRLKTPYCSINYNNESYDDREKTLGGTKNSFSATLDLPLSIVDNKSVLKNMYLFGGYFTTSLKDNNIEFDNDGMIIGLGARY